MANNTTEERLLQIIADSSKNSLGQCGVLMIDDTVEHTGPFVALTAIGTADAVIDSSECTTNIEDAAATITIPEGATIFGSFTSIELDSGAVLAYRKC
jgi:predicted hotdog family 3-hydroxylacyl-ACP dehydratase